MPFSYRVLSTLTASLALLAFAGVAIAQPPPPKAEGIESDDYKWNEMIGEKMEALQLTGDLENGEEAYEICSACHLPSGAGRPDGTFPQLAGQHTTVVIKQIADIREGRRDNPIMYPFAKTLIDPQELADVAAYIETLPIPTDNGKGPDTNLAEGEKLYKRDCTVCHGDHGEGNAEKFYPVLAGQHFKYLNRQIEEIAHKKRRNANPDMVKIVVKYTPEERTAVVDYMSRLEWPERAKK
ncbi:MAG: c-type cytochrome [Deltaproteobacteria bacterium]|nr:c-type cytochrome [Deltaproteobacteria bacterium]MBW2419811.1 c-type cytochrome [Deltaproteobacteria bacterium]